MEQRASVQGGTVSHGVDEGPFGLPANDWHVLSQLWYPFITGHWTKEAPTAPGRYPTADRAGYAATDITIAFNAGHRIENGTAIIEGNPERESWNGWWWSEPYPLLPPAPLAWNDENDET